MGLLLQTQKLLFNFLTILLSKSEAVNGNLYCLSQKPYKFKLQLSPLSTIPKNIVYMFDQWNEEKNATTAQKGNDNTI